MSFNRKFNRAKRLNERKTMSRYINLKVTDEDRENIKKRKDGEGVKDGLFGQAELLRRLLEVSPKTKTNSDLMQLLRISRKLDKFEGEKDPVLEIAEDEFEWVKRILDHDAFGSYGPPLLRRIGELLEAVTGAKTEKESKLHAVE